MANYTESYMKQIDEAAASIREKLPFTPDIAIVLGSGLGPLADEVENPVVIDYSEIKNFPRSTVAGHDGKLVIGTISGKRVIVMKGRFHYYEGYDMDMVTLPTRVFARLGIKFVFCYNDFFTAHSETDGVSLNTFFRTDNCVVSY